MATIEIGGTVFCRILMTLWILVNWSCCKHQSAGFSLKEAGFEGRGTTKILSWNIKDFGGRSSLRLDAIARIILHSQADLVAIQEVVPSTGPQKLVELAELLAADSGEPICLGVSGIPSDGDELYGFLWRYNNIRWAVVSSGDELAPTELCMPPQQVPLATEIASELIREPGIAFFYSVKENQFLGVVNVHFVPTEDLPQQEVSPTFRFADGLSKRLVALFQNLPVIVLGDFNLSPTHRSFVENALSRDFRPALQNVPTSLRLSTRRLNRPYDNFWFRNLVAKQSRVLTLYPLTGEERSLELPDNRPEVDHGLEFLGQDQIRDVYYGISDHSPIQMEVDLPDLLEAPSVN